MRVIFGIGNPGSNYLRNRHNTGFLFLDFFARAKSLEFLPSGGDYYQAVGSIQNFPFSLIKPTTFVNNSGIAVTQIIRKYDLHMEDILVVCDDTNLTLSNFRVRLSGGGGGHNGLASIIYHLNSNNFPRIRIGTGKTLGNNDLAEYVLSDFEKNEVQILSNVFKKASVLAEEFIVGGCKAMLDINSRLSLNSRDN